MRWTPQDLADYEQRRKARSAGICPAKPEPDSGGALELAAKGKDEGNASPDARYRVTFTVFRTRPLDWDNHFVKALQDALVSTDLLPDDSWKTLSGAVECLKCKHRQDERTEITIERL